MFLSRRRRGRDPFVRIKFACLAVGGVLGLVGMRLESVVLVNVAIVVVLAGFALRFVKRASPAESAEAPISEAEPPAPGG